MKLLIMCEGPNELKIINILLENQKLKFTSDDLLGLVPYHLNALNITIKDTNNRRKHFIWYMIDFEQPECYLVCVRAHTIATEEKS